MHPVKMPPAIIDVEASGFGRGSYPIEVGLVLPDGASYCSLIRPAPHWTHWDPAAELLHRIKPQLLAESGRPPAEVAAALNQRLRGEVVYSDGWAHDYAWLALLYDEAAMTPAFKLDSLRKLLSEDELALWHPTQQAIRAEAPQMRHRASTDAKVIQFAVMRLKRLRPAAS